MLKRVVNSLTMALQILVCSSNSDQECSQRMYLHAQVRGPGSYRYCRSFITLSRCPGVIVVFGCRLLQLHTSTEILWPTHSIRLEGVLSDIHSGAMSAGREDEIRNFLNAHPRRE